MVGSNKRLILPNIPHPFSTVAKLSPELYAAAVRTEYEDDTNR
jgi:hypothetical protein